MTATFPSPNVLYVCGPPPQCRTEFKLNQKKEKERGKLVVGKRVVVGTKKDKSASMHVQIRSCRTQTNTDWTDHSNGDGSSWNVPEIRCATLHTDPWQLSQDAQEVNSNKSNPQANKPQIRDG